MRILLAALCGFLMDLVLGDPKWLMPIHPVVIIGNLIRVAETALRNLFPKTKRGELAAGMLLAVLIPSGTWLFCTAVLRVLCGISQLLAFAMEVIWCWQALAIKDLRFEAMQVESALKTGSLEKAREAVSCIVGRDPSALSAEGVARAAVETVAENFSDGVVAPLCYMMLGGAPLALCYKAVNTMDSILGYKTEHYLYFGRAAARMDDAANYIPSRLAALLLIAAAKGTGENAADALRIWKRDRRRHESPNSAQCESVVAGALGLRLCGPACYFGELHDKPWIGDEKRQIEPGDIRRACRMEYAGSALALMIIGGLRLMLVVL